MPKNAALLYNKKIVVTRYSHSQENVGGDLKTIVTMKRALARIPYIGNNVSPHGPREHGKLAYGLATQR